MKVIALKQGYFGKLRMPGDEFDVPEGARASWFASAQTARGEPVLPQNQAVALDAWPADDVSQDGQENAASDDKAEDANAKPAAKPVSKRTRAVPATAGEDSV